MKKFNFLDLSKELLPRGRTNGRPDSQDDKHKIDWRAILKQSAAMVYDQDTAKDAKSFKRLDHDPFPAADIQRKVDFFFLPYSCEQNVCEHMNIPEGGTHKPDGDSRWEAMRNFICGEHMDAGKRRRIYELMWKYKGMQPAADAEVANIESPVNAKSPKRMQTQEPASFDSAAKKTENGQDTDAYR